MKVIKYFVEAADNAKFLNVIEKSSHAIYLEDPARLKKHLFRLLHVVKMIFNISTFYNSPERVASLLGKLSFIILVLLVEFSTNVGPPPLLVETSMIF